MALPPSFPSFDNILIDDSLSLPSLSSDEAIPIDISSSAIDSLIGMWPDLMMAVEAI